jgi:O-antigen ligase
VAMFESPSRATLVFAWGLCLAAVSVTSLGLLWMLGSGAITVIWDSRVSTEVLNPISVGYLGASVVVLCLARPFRWPGEGRLPGAWRGLVFLLLGLGGAVLAVASGSRGPLLALVLVVAAWLVMSPVQRSRRGWRIAARVAFAVLAIAGVTAAAVLVVEILGINPFERFIWLLEDDSVGYRRQALAGSMAQFAMHPWFGDALIERSTLDYPHNIYVESLMSVGLVGTLGLVVFTATAVLAALRLLRRDVDAAWLGMLCLLQVFGSLTSGALYLSDAFWALGAASIAAGSTQPFFVRARRERPVAVVVAGAPATR